MKSHTMRPLRIDVNFPQAFCGDAAHPEIRKFMVAKANLIDGQYYFGTCRNSSCAKWDASAQSFRYMRFKFGSSFEENIFHPEDDKGFDLFVPVFACFPQEYQLLPEDREDSPKKPT